MRVIYFTYNQDTQYLKFYFRPTESIDGVIVLNDEKSFVFFRTPQRSVQETLRIIDKDVELFECRFSYHLDDLFFFVKQRSAVNPCKITSALLAHFSTAFLMPDSSQVKNRNTPVKLFSFENSNLKTMDLILN